MSLAAHGRNGVDPDVACDPVVGSDRAFADIWYRSAPMVLESAQTALGSMVEGKMSRRKSSLGVRKARALQPEDGPDSVGPAFVNQVLETGSSAAGGVGARSCSCR